MKKLLFIFVLSVLLSACTQNVTIYSGDKKIPIKVEIADTYEARLQGLMYRTKLDDGNGMLFVFDDELIRMFWMKNTLIPLDIVFFNNKMEAVSIVENMMPCVTRECADYSSQYLAKYALELPAGYVKKEGIKVGDRLER